MITLNDLEGYSVAKHGDRYLVIRGDMQVATISQLEFNPNKTGFNWHVRDMWKFVSTDFVTAAH